MVPYFLHRRWNCNEYKSKDRRCGTEKSGYDSFRKMCIRDRYDGGNLVLTTGTSLRFFTLDKSLDHLWDEFVAAFLKEKKIC